ncbi:cytochrome b [Marinicella pacifica]|jgi:cytochrome b561|uniref:Cytochrome b n=1 Tax=Marinicella pacifica TaxID=1171543 RepID=A0A917CNV0_9GAMM|nr:cytochrome b/b6 domain-containing protein [Marinicella pacifica]GGF93907.1 cytochrome b [Marinicella pacifica]
MNWKDTPDQYGFISRFNHWFAALIVIVMVILGLYFTSLPKGDARSYWAGWHVNLGGLFFIYLLFRVMWRAFTHSPKPFEQPQPFKFLSQLVHVVLLTCIAIMALSGPMLLFSNGYDLNVFGWFTIPSPIATENHDLHELVEEVHVITGTVLWVTIIVHVLASFKHLITNKGAVMHRIFKSHPTKQ